MRKFLAVIISVMMVVTMVPAMAFAEDSQVSPEATNGENYVTVEGLSELDGMTFSTMNEAYDAGKAVLSKEENGGLGQGGLKSEKFDEVYSDKGNITWTVYGNHDFSEAEREYFLTFGRKAKHYGERHIEKIVVKGGNADKNKDSILFASNITVNYEWWNCGKFNEVEFKDLTINMVARQLLLGQDFNDGIKLSMDNCIVNGALYLYNNNKGDLSFTNNTFNGQPNSTDYGVMVQGDKGTDANGGADAHAIKVNFVGNTVKGYNRGINFDQNTGEYTITNNDITPGEGYSAIQISRGKSANIENNNINIPVKGAALTIHESFTTYKSDGTINFKNNTITVAPGGQGYLIYDDVLANNKEYGNGDGQANVKLNWTGNKLSGNIDKTKGIKGDKIFEVSECLKEAIDAGTPPTPPSPSVPSTPEPEVVPPTVDAGGNIETTVKPDESGKVETTVPSETITESLDKVTQSPSTEKPVVEIVVKEEAGSKPADSVDVKVPAEAVDKVAKTEDASLKVTTSVGTVELDNDALNKVASEANGEVVTITVEKQDVKEITSEAQKETIESFGKEDYVFEISVRAGARMIRQLEGEMTFEVDYELKEGELPENVRVYCVDEDGNKQRVEAKYDEKTKKLVMKTDYLSIFAVSYVDAPSKVKVLKASNEKGKAALRWSRATNGPDGYRVYRAKTKDGKYSPIAWVKDGKAKTFKEKAKKTNKTYYYKVRAYKNVDGKKVWGEYSPVKKLKF